jgi:hypothetical protein
MTSTRIRVDASPSIRFPIWNLVIGTYLKIGAWKFNPASKPTRQLVKARSMPNTFGFQPPSRLPRPWRDQPALRSRRRRMGPGRTPMCPVPLQGRLRNQGLKAPWPPCLGPFRTTRHCLPSQTRRDGWPVPYGTSADCRVDRSLFIDFIRRPVVQVSATWLIDGRGRSLRAVRLFRLHKRPITSIDPLPHNIGFGCSRCATPPDGAERPSPTCLEIDLNDLAFWPVPYLPPEPEIHDGLAGRLP